MTRSVSQLLFAYLPNRTVSWEDGGGIVRLGTPRIESLWALSDAAFVLSEVGQYLERWRVRGEVDRRFPATTQTERFSVGTPRGISATLLPTAYYCRRCFRFLPRVRRGADNIRCPDCRRPTLRQISYVFVHGCGELVPIRDWIPFESRQQPGTIFRAPIRCQQCGDRSVLRLDARSERLSALRITCENCGGQVIGRPLARCPYCLPRLFADADQPGQLAFRTAMRITRHSANNAYYAHSINVLRLDRPRTVQASDEVTRLQRLLPATDRQEATGVADVLGDLVNRLAAAEAAGSAAQAAQIREAIGAAAQGQPPLDPGEREGGVPPALELDVIQSVRESVALLSSVTRQDVTRLQRNGREPPLGNTSQYEGVLRSMGLSRLELVEDLPVISAVFGYSRRSANPEYEEEGAAEPFPTTLRPFPTLDDDAARILGRPQAAGTTPILAREGVHEGLALYLDPSAVVRWLGTNGIQLDGAGIEDQRSDLLSRLEPVERFYDDIWECPVRRLVYGLLHSVSHCAMKALGRTAGLEDTSVSEYVFTPLLCTVVYSTSNTNLGGVQTTASQRLLEFLDTLQERATRCLYDPDCLQRVGACHGCLHVPEIGCRVFNHGLSRALLVGGHAPWTPAGDPSTVVGYWQQTDDG